MLFAELIGGFMPLPFRLLAACVSVFILSCVVGLPTSFAQAPAPVGPNSDPTYQALRNIKLGTDAVTVENFVLHRDAATFHLRNGTVCFVSAVQGKVTGAVFVGDGTMSFDAPSADERRSLKLLTKSDEFSENYNHLVLRFTDGTYDEIKKAGTATTSNCDPGLLHNSQDAMRHKLHTNLDARILADVLRSGPGGMFVAFVHGKAYEDKLLYIVDPDGAPEAAPDEVELMTYNENRSGVWSAFRMSKDYRATLGAGAIPAFKFHVDSQNLDTTIEGSGKLIGLAKTTIVPALPGIRAIPFELFPTLRAESVSGADGKPLAFIQEDKNDDPQFWVVVPEGLKPGEKFTITTSYQGKDAVLNTGNGNYYPVAREDWFPANASSGLGDFTNFDMIFHTPKGMKVAASGDLVSESDEHGHHLSEWKSAVPQPTACFEFGLMKEEDAKLTKPDFLIATYANEEPPDAYKQLTNIGTMGNLSTVSMMKQPLSEAQYAIRLYTDYFGPLPFKRLSVAQQTACNYGQSWPELVWLPICAFYDTTVRHQLALDFQDNGYWDVVTPHEVSHQWWGQFVGFDSYRDQWMSEGFADFSASLFLQSAYGKDSPKKFAQFWSDQHKLLVEKNQFGYRAIDVGPVTMGYRLNNTKVGGNIYQFLVYPKGAYILHMIRMMMWDRQTGDQNFKAMMQDFVKTYGGRAASTEDFKAMVEKHMNRDMNLAGDGKMDWFFNEYVYGTALPTYSFTSSFEKDAQGNVVFSYNLQQTGVDSSFMMSVPVYFELADGRHVMLGHMAARGNQPITGKITLEGLKDAPQRALINYNNDILATN
jgi:hypothetical protein